MKVLTKYLRILPIFIGLLGLSKSYSQTCTINFTYQYLGSGTIGFTTNAVGNSSTTVYTWNFGNGTPTFTGTGFAGAYPYATYTASGVYTVNVTAFTAPSCLANSTQTILVTLPPCSLVPNFNYTVTPSGGVVNFANTSSGMIGSTTYLWFSGNGQQSSFLNPSFTYSANGTYTVKLVVNNNTIPICSDSITQIITVNNVTSPCNLNSNFAYSIGANGLVYYSNLTTGASSLTSYSWKFGGGDTSALQSPQLTYSAAGAYVTTLTANGPGTCTSTYTSVVNVCIRNFTMSTGPNGQLFLTNTTAGTASTALLSWTVSGGSFYYAPGSTIGNTHSLTVPANGVYTVGMYVPSPCGGVVFNTVTITNVNTSTCNLNANFTYSYAPNGLVNIFNTSTGTLPNSTYYYIVQGMGLSSTLSNPNFNFTSNGTYTVKLWVTNSISPYCVDSTFQLITVNNVGPCNLVAGFAHTVTTNGMVNFANSSTGTIAGTIYYWNFGDGTTGFGASPNHAYPSSGAYVVVLTAINNSVNCISTASTVINITGINCVANSNFSVAPTSTAQVWTATPSFPWNVTNAIWTWGDGSPNSTGLYTSHSYSVAGNYQICLTVTVSCGSTSSTCATYSITKMNASSAMVHINVVPPQLVEVGVEDLGVVLSEINFYPNPNNGLVNLNVSTNSSAPMNIQVLDLSGKAVYETMIDATQSQTTHQLYLQELSNGIYILQLKQAGQRLNKKLIISKD